MMPQHQHTPTTSRGYALLLAILIANIILAMSLGVFSIALKEVMLATYLKDSQSAFGAADHLLECALYWDRSFPQNGMPYTIFATSTGYVTPGAINSAVCDGIQLNLAAAPPAGNNWFVTKTAVDGRTTFSMKFLDGTCADVTVLHNAAGVLVTSNGYNNCNANNPRRTQRTIEVFTNI